MSRAESSPDTEGRPRARGPPRASFEASKAGENVRARGALPLDASVARATETAVTTLGSAVRISFGRSCQARCPCDAGIEAPELPRSKRDATGGAAQARAGARGNGTGRGRGGRGKVQGGRGRGMQRGRGTRGFAEAGRVDGAAPGVDLAGPGDLARSGAGMFGAGAIGPARSGRCDRGRTHIGPCGHVELSAGESGRDCSGRERRVAPCPFARAITRPRADRPTGHGEDVRREGAGSAPGVSGRSDRSGGEGAGAAIRFRRGGRACEAPRGGGKPARRCGGRRLRAWRR